MIVDENFPLPRVTDKQHKKIPPPYSNGRSIAHNIRIFELGMIITDRRLAGMDPGNCKWGLTELFYSPAGCQAMIDAAIADPNMRVYRNHNWCLWQIAPTEEFLAGCLKRKRKCSPPSSPSPS